VSVTSPVSSPVFDTTSGANYEVCRYHPHSNKDTGYVYIHIGYTRLSVGVKLGLSYEAKNIGRWRAGTGC
jgi:hypothetical protein